MCFLCVRMHLSFTSPCIGTVYYNRYIYLYPNKLQSPLGSWECEILNKLRVLYGKFDVVHVFFSANAVHPSLCQHYWMEEHSNKNGFALGCVHLPKGCDESVLHMTKCKIFSLKRFFSLLFFLINNISKHYCCKMFFRWYSNFLFVLIMCWCFNLQGYDISFLITNYHCEEMQKHKLIDFIVQFMEARICFTL